MSLLMQALKKAEQAKQTGASDSRPMAEEELSKRVGLSGISLLPSDAISVAGNEQHDLETAEVSDFPQLPKELVNEAATALSQIELTPLEESVSAPLNEPVQGSGLEQQSARQEPDNTLPPSEEVEGGISSPIAAAQPDSDAPAVKNIGLAAAQSGTEQRHAALDEMRNVAAVQHRAKNVFLSKKNTGKRRTVMISAGGIAGITALGLGLWYMNAAGLFENSAVMPANVAIAPMPTPSVPPEKTSVREEVAADAAIVPVTPVAVAPAEEKQKISTPLATVTTGSITETPAQPEHIADAKPPGHLQSAVYPVEQPGIQFRQTAEVGQVNLLVSQAYQAFMAGDLNTAEQKYRRALFQEPNSRDTLLGLAAVALKRQQKEQAASYFLKLLEADPADPDAGAGLLSLQQGDLVQNESRLKKILAQHPGSGAVQFALGNLYSRQARWGEAQQAYFQAFSSASGNADYAFNLAVSLDRLSQPRLALEYYQRALKLAAGGQGNFNAESVLVRVKELQTAANE